MRRAALALSLFAFSALPAAAQVKMTWNTTATDTGANLAFGVPETDNTLLSFLCDKGNDMVLVSSHIGTKDLKADEAARILLTAGKVKKTLNGKGVLNEESASVDVEAGASMKDLKELLAGGKTLQIETKGAKQQVALMGAPAAFGSFEATCKAQ